MKDKSSNGDLRVKLRATLEAQRLVRLSLDDAHKKLHQLQQQTSKKQGRKAKNFKEASLYTVCLAEQLQIKLEEKEEALSNMECGVPIDGGVGFGFGGGSGNDAG